MKTFTIECDDDCFQLVLVLPDENRVDVPVDYCSVSSIVAPDGRVVGVYLNGSEPELAALDADPDPEAVSVVSKLIQVYDLTKWPILTPIPGAVVTLQLTDLSEDEEGDGEAEGDEEDEAIEVTPL